jgi:tetratricopeptide (TPR) repeat protein
VPRRPSTHIDDPAAVGRRLREERERAGLSQRQLAFPGCTAAYISRVEAGARIPSLQILRELARRIGTTADYLATGSDESELSVRLADAEAAVRFGDLDTAAVIFEDILSAAPGHSEEQAAHFGLAEIAFRRGEHRRVVELLQHYAERPQQPPLAPDHAAWLADRLGRAYAYLGEAERSLATLERGLDDARAAGDSSATLRLATLLANSLLDAGDPGQASELLGQALRLAEQARDPHELARAWWSEARVHIRQGKLDVATRYLRKAIGFSEGSEHLGFAATAHQMLARIENDRGNAADALQAVEHGEPLATCEGNRYLQALFEVERARALAGLGDTGQAGSVAHKAAVLLEDARPVAAGRAYGVIADVFRQLGENVRAREIYELAAERLDPDDPFQAEIHTALGELWEAEGNTAEAMAAYKRAASVRARATAG